MWLFFCLKERQNLQVLWASVFFNDVQYTGNLKSTWKHEKSGYFFSLSYFFLINWTKIFKKGASQHLQFLTLFQTKKNFILYQTLIDWARKYVAKYTFREKRKISFWNVFFTYKYVVFCEYFPINTWWSLDFFWRKSSVKSSTKPGGKYLFRRFLRVITMLNAERIHHVNFFSRFFSRG